MPKKGLYCPMKQARCYTANCGGCGHLNIGPIRWMCSACIRDGDNVSTFYSHGTCSRCRKYRYILIAIEDGVY